MITSLIQNIRSHLITTHEELDTWFEVDKGLGYYRPLNHGWTIYEILEHVALTSHFLLKLIDKGGNKALKMADPLTLAAALTDYQFQEDKLTEVGLHQSFTWFRPDHMVPKGEMDLMEVRVTLKMQKNLCLDWLDKLPNGEGALAKTTMSVHDLGKIDVYHYIYFLSQHAKRHIAQMKKNKDELFQSPISQ